MNQWKNTNNFIDWFINIDNKHQCTFIQLDIKDFYPSITEEILEKSLELQNNMYTSMRRTFDQLIIAENHCYFLTMNHGKRRTLQVVLT